MAQQWFVQIEEQIHGPLTTQEVESRLQSGQLSSNNLVWGQGMEHWRNLQSWAQESQTIATNFDQTMTTEIARDVWHYAAAGESFGPFQREILIESLKGLGNISEVLLWTKGMKEWAPLFEFHDILTAMGVNKRQFPRADINGEVAIKTNTGQTLMAPLITISEGGMGVQLETEGLTSGMSVTLEISSPSFRDTLIARADVRYAAGGVTGLKFSNLSPEVRGAIVSFVKQSQTRFVLRAS